MKIIQIVVVTGSDNIQRKPVFLFVCTVGLLFILFVYQYYISDFHSMLAARETKLPFTSVEDFISKRTHSLVIPSKFSAYDEIKVLIPYVSFFLNSVVM